MVKRIYLIFFFSIVSMAFFETAYFKNKKGNELFDKGNYDEAIKNYREAQIEDTDSPVLYYNLGNIYYKKNEYKKADEEYKKALKNSKGSLKPKVLFNMGNNNVMNALSNIGKGRKEDASHLLKEAIKSYEDAKNRSPKDKDIDFNLEFARKKLKEVMQDMKKEPQAGDKDNKQDNDKKTGKGSDSNQDKGDGEEKKEDRNKEKGNDKDDVTANEPLDKNDEGKKKGSSSNKDKAEKMILKKEAEKILGAMEQDDSLKRALINRHKVSDNEGYIEKDW